MSWWSQQCKEATPGELLPVLGSTMAFQWHSMKLMNNEMCGGLGGSTRVAKQQQGGRDYSTGQVYFNGHFFGKLISKGMAFLQIQEMKCHASGKMWCSRYIKHIGGQKLISWSMASSEVYINGFVQLPKYGCRQKANSFNGKTL